MLRLHGRGGGLLMPEHEQSEQPQPEIVINKSSSRDGLVGWRIGLIRREGESDDQYTQRVLDKHEDLERELTMRVCCHDADGCATISREAAKTEVGL